MLIKTDKLACLLEKGHRDVPDPFVVLPQPDLFAMRQRPSGSLDLHLGRWFLSIRSTRHALLDPTADSKGGDDHSAWTKSHFVPFGDKFVIHPAAFVLAATLEWLRLPAKIGGYLTGKSSLGRRGLIIETAAGIQPGFSGCLTLEITNFGDVPIVLKPGMAICQAFFHTTTRGSCPYFSALACKRRPVWGAVKSDPLTEKLIRKGGR